MASSSGGDKYGVFRDIPDGTAVKPVGVTAFKEKVQRPDPDLFGRDMRSHGVIEESHGREILRSRYRSGSFTESHFTPGNDSQPHSAYHYSARDKTVYSVKSDRATTTRKSHKDMGHLF
jgi:hypothetical protein